MNKTALVVVDVQNYFINRHTRHIPSLVASYIQSHPYDLVIFTIFINQPNSNFRRILEWDKCTSSPDIDLSFELDNLTNEPNPTIIQRCSYSAVTNDLEQVLHFNQIEKIDLCGIDSDACVIATAFDLFDQGYDFKILEKLCASTEGEEVHKAALKLMQRNLKRQKNITA